MNGLSQNNSKEFLDVVVLVAKFEYIGKIYILIQYYLLLVVYFFNRIR